PQRLRVIPSGVPTVITCVPNPIGFIDAPLPVHDAETGVGNVPGICRRIFRHTIRPIPSLCHRCGAQRRPNHSQETPTALALCGDGIRVVETESVETEGPPDMNRCLTQEFTHHWVATIHTVAIVVAVSIDIRGNFH